MKTFKTPKGTELPLMDIKGKPYLQVAHRIVWLREEHPDWSIETTLVELDTAKQYAIFRATIKDSTDRLIATATKVETKVGFADYLEKAETGSIGRALALCGYGTQFAPELDEGNRLADSPVTPARKAQLKAEYSSRIAQAKKDGDIETAQKLVDEFNSLGKVKANTTEVTVDEVNALLSQNES